MKYVSKFLTLLFFISALSILSACGKVSDPVPYEGSGYPHSYPRS